MNDSSKSDIQTEVHALHRIRIFVNEMLSKLFKPRHIEALSITSGQTERLKEGYNPYTK